MLTLNEAQQKILEASVEAGHYPDVETALEAALYAFSFSDDYQESPEEIAELRRRYQDAKAGRNMIEYDSAKDLMDDVRSEIANRVAARDKEPV